MVKCEVLDNCVLTVGKGSIVEVSEKQFNIARRVLKPLEIKEAKSEKVDTVENTVDVPKKETRKKKTK